jgi:hypothetical protein
MGAAGLLAGSRLLLVWGLAGLAAPWLTKNQLQKAIREQLERRAMVGKIDFRPWTLELTINDLAIASQDGGSSQVQLKRMYVNPEIESLFRLAPVIETLQLDSPQLKLTRLGAGKYDIAASLEILGKLNPLAKPLELDIKARVHDLELPPLSPYSVKYAGYGITRGKLSVDVSYLILPNGQLMASKKGVLNQLTFGDKVESAPNSLPVKLAVALRADRYGVIDIDLPLSGSLNDPQFRLGPIIVKVIVNLIVKAVMAPFNLLASAFGGGGDQLGVVAFAPRSAMLSPPATQGLDKVAKALVQRPALKMTVVGTANLVAEREAYQRERLQALLQAEKRRALVTSGGSTQAAALVVVEESERSALLKQA